MSIRSAIGHAVDGFLEFTMVGSYTRIGPAIRRRLLGWQDLPPNALVGRVVVITGATSGLGREAAVRAVHLGAAVVMVVRNASRGASVAEEIRLATRAGVSLIIADLTNLDDVRRAAAELRRLPSIDVLVHNGGALSSTRRTSPQGIEETLAAHVVAPFLLTHLVLPQLRAVGGRVIVVTSAGMYTEALDAGTLGSMSDPYRGTAAYARAKRAQVSMVEECAPRLRRAGVTLVAMHPGWANTPGLQQSLPGFHAVMRPLLRSPAQGADTIVWLAAADGDLITRGRPGVWLDRAPRPLHRRRSTLRSDTAEERARLRRVIRAMSGLTDEEARCALG